MNTDLYLLSILLLTIISALFSCAETAITSASKAKINRLVEEGSKAARKLEKILLKREKALSAMLVGNNIVNIAASVLTTNILVQLFGEAGMIYATITLTVLIIIFSEITPKTIALKAPTKFALGLIPLIVWTTRILYPFTHLIQNLVDFFTNLFFGKPKTRSHQLELQEIRETIELKHKEGSIFKYEKDLIAGVLDLSEMEIKEIMIHRKNIESLNIDLPTDELTHLALETGHTRIPLWRKDKENIVAILNIKKLIKELRKFQKSGNDFSKLDLATVTDTPWFVPASNKLRTQLFAFRNKKKRIALVVNEYGSLLGLITVEDIIDEIVGDIRERGERSETEITKINDNSYHIAGHTLVRDLNKKLEWQLSEDDNAHNLAALIINYLRRIPNTDEEFEIDGYKFKILERKNNDLVRIEVIDQTSTADNLDVITS